MNPAGATAEAPDFSALVFSNCIRVGINSPKFAISLLSAVSNKTSPDILNVIGNFLKDRIFHLAQCNLVIYLVLTGKKIDHLEMVA